MKKYRAIYCFLVFFLIELSVSCADEKMKEKGFDVSEVTVNNSTPIGLSKDSLKFKTQPSNVLMTASNEHRLMTLFKINYKSDSTETFVGSNEFHHNYQESYVSDAYGNNWNGNIIAGFKAVYGYKMVNVSHYNFQLQKQNNFFEKPVLIKTLYYPSNTKDTLNFKPITRNFYLVSCYDQDTNNDKKINFKDLRRLYFFNINGENKTNLIPKNYTVVGSDYDSSNDFLNVYTKLDLNNNGSIEKFESLHVFYIDLKNPDVAIKMF